MDKAEKKRLASEKKTAEKAAKAAAKEAKKLEKQKAADERKRAKEASKRAKKAGGGAASSLAPPTANGPDGSATAAFKNRVSQRVSPAAKKATASSLASFGAALPPLQSVPAVEEADSHVSSNTDDSNAGTIVSATGDEDGLDELGDAFELPADSQAAMPPASAFLPPAAAAKDDAEAPAAAAGEEPVNLYEMAGSTKTTEEAAAEAAASEQSSDPINLYEMAGSKKTAEEESGADRKEAWENAADWLTEIGVLPKIDPEVLKTFERPPNVYDFIVTLKSGVALCNALNVLVPETTKPYPSPNKQFLRDKNIYKFLEGCADVGVDEEDLFLAEHLSEGSSIPAVVHTLAVISQLDVAVEKGFTPFDVPEDDEAVFADLYNNVEDVILSFEEGLASQEDASIYELAAAGDGSAGLYGLANAEELSQPVSLYEMADSSKTAADVEIDMKAPGAIYEIAKQRHAAEATYEIAAPTKSHTGGGGDSGPSDVYSVATNAEGGDNGDPRNNDPRYSMMTKALASQETVMDTEGGTYTAAMAVDQVIYQDSDPSMYQVDRDSSKHRAHAILELSDTETKYVGVLKIITETYYGTIAANPTVFSEDDKMVLFANTFELLEIHTAFEKLLQRALVGDSASGRVISPVFESSLDCFTAYGEYCCRMMLAIDRYEKLLAESADAKRIFAECQEESGQGFPFRVMLNVPMQRILKYPLLLREIVRGTEKATGEHADIAGLESAQAALGSLATLVNETMRHFENITQLSESLQKYDGPPLFRYYPFYRHAAQRVILKDDNLAYRGPGAKDKVAKRYVFLPAKKGMYDFKEVVELTADTVVAAVSPMPKNAVTGKFKFGCTITQRDGAECTLTARAETMAEQWVKAIQHNVRLIKEQKSRPPPKIPAPAPMPAVEAPAVETGGGGGSVEDTYAKVNKGAAKHAAAATAAVKKPRTSAGGAPRPKKKQAAPAKLKLAGSALSESFQFFKWFAGKMDKAGAEANLAGKPDGTFLIRESASKAGSFTLAIVSQGACCHMALKRPPGGTATMVTIGGRGIEHDSIPDLIMHHQESDIGGNCPTKMSFPYKQ